MNNLSLSLLGWHSASHMSINFQGLGQEVGNLGKYPLVLSTWPFLEAVRAAWRAADSGYSAVDAVVEGCSACEELRCDGTGGH